MKISRILPVILILLAAPVFAAKPLEYRVWQLQDYNMPHMKHMIDEAAAHGANRIQLSHKIVMVTEQVFEWDQRAKDINEACRYAHARGLKVDVWTHELNGVPEELLKDGKADLDDPKLWQWMKEKYERFFKLCPEIDGLVLTMQETAMSIYHDNKVSSSVPPEKRVAKLIDDTAEVCKSFNKTLFVRTFSYQPDELDYICKGLKECKSDIIVMSKCQPHDWQPYYPHNAAIGNIGNHPQIIEFDLGYEFLGISKVPYIDLDYLKYRLDYGLSKGIVGGVIRIERYKWWAVGTPNWANIEVFSKMLLDPSLDQKALFNQWVAARYGKEAAPYVVSALSRTFDIVNKSYFSLGFWYTDHSFLQGYDTTRTSLWMWSSGKWDKRKKTLGWALLNPSHSVRNKVIVEKNEAVRLAYRSAADIERAKPYLDPKDYTELKRLMENEKAMAEVWREHARTYFAIGIARRTNSIADKAEMLQSAMRLESIAKKYNRQLVEIASDYANKENKTNLKGVESLVNTARETASK